MSLTTITAEEALRRLDEFGIVIDARSEDEYAEDHLPGAVNWPTLNNEERKLVGTMYKQVNAFEASNRGAQYRQSHRARGAGQTQGLEAAGLLLARRQTQRLPLTGAEPDRLSHH